MDKKYFTKEILEQIQFLNTNNVMFGIRNHCGGLKESIETTKYITFNEWKSRFKDYSYYGFDIRVNQLLFILDDMQNKHNIPTWLFIQLSPKVLENDWKN